MWDKWILVVVILCLSSCSGSQPFPKDPKDVIKAYISTSFGLRNVKDRVDLERYLTGDAKSRLASWSNQQLSKAFIERKRKFIKLKFLETKKISPNEVNVTYELTYLDQGSQKERKITNKKLSFLVFKKEKWLIREVRNIRELVEYQNEMALP